MTSEIDKAGTEPLGDRIIEVPADPEATELKRDPHSGYIAYAPIGAVAAGRALATSNGKTLACAGCHVFQNDPQMYQRSLNIRTAESPSIVGQPQFQARFGIRV